MDFFHKFLSVLGGESFGTAGLDEVFHSFVGGGGVMEFFAGEKHIVVAQSSINFGLDEFLLAKSFHVGTSLKGLVKV